MPGAARQQGLTCSRVPPVALRAGGPRRQRQASRRSTASPAAGLCCGVYTLHERATTIVRTSRLTIELVYVSLTRQRFAWA